MPADRTWRVDTTIPADLSRWLPNAEPIGVERLSGSVAVRLSDGRLHLAIVAVGEPVIYCSFDWPDTE